MRNHKIVTLVGLLLLLVSICTLGFAKEDKKDDGKSKGLPKVETNDHYAYFLINNILNLFSNNGDGSYNPYTLGSGLEFPKGTGKTAIFEDGLVWGGFPSKTGQLSVGGSAYRHALQAGKITTPGTATTSPVADAATGAGYRVYRVRPDVTPAIPFTDALATKLTNEESNLITRDVSSQTAQAIYNQYIKDWNEWPASQGAPFVDKNGNGTYDPLVDSAGIGGADQTLWHVSNDMSVSRVQNLAGANPIGFEVQRTIWGYNQSGALGNTIFIRYKVINYSGGRVDSLFFVQWSDPDLGDASDDYAGCDVSRSLGFVYNGKGTDLVYGDAPPASGFVFFAGPAIKTGKSTDVGIVNLQYRNGVKNLGMSSFNFFINGNPLYTDPAQGTYVGTKQWYNLMNGLIGTTGAPNIDAITGKATLYALSGDPVTGQGWLDGGVAPPGDRRMCLTTGPVYMQDKDTAEIVVAELVGQGADRISSVTALREVCDQAQAAFNLLFDIPKPPKAPVVSVTPFDGGLVLNWSDATQVTAIESNYSSKGFTFEGYRLQQFPRPSNIDGKTVKVFDLPDPVLDNGGVQRYYITTDDVLNGTKLVNGRSYYFGVSSIAYNPTGVPPVLEGSPSIFEAIPQAEVPGTQFSAKPNSTIDVAQTAGSGSVAVTATVIDPKALVSGNYEIAINSTVVGGNTVYTWDWKQGATTLFGNQALAAASPSSPIFQGVQVAVELGPQDIDSNYAYKNGASLRWYSGAAGLGAASDLYRDYISLTTKLDWSHTTFPIELRFTGVGAVSGTKSNDTTIVSGGQWGTYYEYPAFAKSYSDTTPSGFKYKQIRFPFEVWDTQHNRQLRVWATSRNSDSKAQWQTSTGGFTTAYWTANKPFWWRMWGRDYFVFVDKTYRPGTADTAAVVLPTDSLTTYMGSFVGSASSPSRWSNGDVWRMTFTQPPVGGVDQFAFTVSGSTTGDANLAKTQVEQINCFPNPYFGFNKAEVNKYSRFVTFSHLPAQANIRIYTISGILVRTLMKNDPTQFTRWDLLNSAGLPVGSGMYVVHVEMPGLGVSKIIKVAIIQPNQILDRL